MIPFETLKGKILSRVKVIDDKEINFETDDGEKYKLYHSQDCCEQVDVEDIAGDLEDLLHEPILLAEEAVSENVTPEGLPQSNEDSFTWTFYKLATIKGSVTIRFFGSSNGYYSESVNFAEEGCE